MKKLVFEHLAVILAISDDKAEEHVEKVLKYENFFFLDTSSEFPLKLKNEQNDIEHPRILDKIKTGMSISINNHKNNNPQQIRPALREYESIRGGFIFKK